MPVIKTKYEQTLTLYCLRGIIFDWATDWQVSKDEAGLSKLALILAKIQR